MKKILLSCFFIAFVAFSSCVKPGKGGKAIFPFMFLKANPRAMHKIRQSFQMQLYILNMVERARMQMCQIMTICNSQISEGKPYLKI